MQKRTPLSLLLQDSDSDDAPPVLQQHFAGRAASLSAIDAHAPSGARHSQPASQSCIRSLSSTHLMNHELLTLFLSSPAQCEYLLRCCCRSSTVELVSRKRRLHFVGAGTLPSCHASFTTQDVLHGADAPACSHVLTSLVQGAVVRDSSEIEHRQARHLRSLNLS
jgi:hypothetical protein